MAYNPYYFVDSDSDDSDSEQLEESMEVDHGGDTTGSDYSMSNGSRSVSSNAHRSAAGTSSEGSRMSFPAFSANDHDSQSISSYEHNPSQESSRTPSPGNSVISLTESLRTHMVKEEYGRDLNNYCDTYRLPADEEEWDRLENQHRVFINLKGNKYPTRMAEVLQSTIPREKKVLDLGAGNGSWIKDVARDFPLCEAVAVDLVPLLDTDDMPPNLRSEVDDINLGLQHFYNGFDVVHVRLVSSGIKDYQQCIEHISRIVRPGGLIEIAEFDFRTYDASHNRIEISLDDPPQPPYWSRFMCHVNHAVQQLGGDVNAATHLLSWVSDHDAFEDVAYQDVWIPAVAAKQSFFSDEVDSAMRKVVMSWARTARPMLLGTGFSEELYDFYEAYTDREIREGLIPQFTRLQTVCATRRRDAVLPGLDDD